MNVITDLIGWFGLNMIESAVTLPQLLQYIVCAMLACFMVVEALRAMFHMITVVNTRLR